LGHTTPPDGGLKLVAATKEPWLRHVVNCSSQSWKDLGGRQGSAELLDSTPVPPVGPPGAAPPPFVSPSSESSPGSSPGAGSVSESSSGGEGSPDGGGVVGSSVSVVGE